jgi:autotransporter-associated beta strand protein
MLLVRRWPAIAAGCLLAFGALPARAQVQVWTLPAAGSWNLDANWNPGPHPNAIDATAVFNNAATGQNPAQTGNRAVTLDAAQIVGTINFNNDAANTFTNSITTGAAGSTLTFEVSTGSATINVPAAVGTGNNQIAGPIILNSNLVANVDQVTATSAAGALNLTATISGTGSFTKNGDGLATFGTGAKTYTGPTVLNGGRMRMSRLAEPTATSSVTVNAGAQLTPIATAGTFTFGGTVLNLNGAGPTTGPFAAFPGALRPDTNLGVTITTPSVVLQSDSLIHVQGSASGVLTLTGNISGPGMLSLTPVGTGPPNNPFDANLGRMVLSGSANTYGGGTTVNGGTLEVAAGSSLGTGNVTVRSANAFFGGAQAHIQLDTGVVNAIADTAILSLDGGNVAGTADDGYIDLQAGVNEFVGGLILGGVTQTTPGTYGSTASGALFPNDEFFAGTGLVTLTPIPEPGTLALAGLAAVGLAIRRFRRKPVDA